MLEKMKAARVWLQGKKTYLVGGGLMVAAVVGVAVGWMGMGTATLVGVWGLSMIPQAAKSNRQHKQLMVALGVAAAVGVAAREGGIAAVEGAIKQELPQLQDAFGGGE